MFKSNFYLSNLLINRSSTAKFFKMSKPTSLFQTSTLKVKDASIEFSNSLTNPTLSLKTDEIATTLNKASSIIKAGELVGMPTETVYGLGANGLDAEACQKIYKTKGRPSDNPLILHISSLSMLRTILPNLEEKIYLKYLPVMEAFWPGPLTLLFPKSSLIPDIVTGKGSTVAIRFPKNAVSRALIQLADVPIAAPSANKSGRPSPTTAQHVSHDLDGLIPLILDNGPCDVGVESTVLDGLSDIPIILRPGAITGNMLQRFNGFEKVVDYKKENFDAKQAHHIENFPQTPGMKYQHYSPDAKVILLDSAQNRRSLENFLDKVQNVLKELNNSVKKVRIITTLGNELPQGACERFKDVNFDVSIKSLNGSLNDYNQVALNLFDSLRQLDEDSIDVAIYQSVPDTSIGLAIMNRLRKAAQVTYNY